MQYHYSFINSLNNTATQSYSGKRSFINLFDQSHEVIFRSLTSLIQTLGRKYYPVRGKSINELIKKINEKSFSKVTLGGCYVERVNETILISEENSHKV